MALSRRDRALLIGLGLLALVALSALHIHAKLARGESVFWLAELWAPTAFFSAGLVTGIEALLPSRAPEAATKAPRRRAKRKKA